MKTIFKTPLRAAAFASLLFFAQASNASLEAVMQNQFNAMVNVTDPSASMGAQRGVVQLGGIHMSNKISQANLVSFTAPGFKAGCGGIDAWGGSFSFISGDQLKAFAENVVSNAAGYFFHLAMQRIPDASAVLKWINDQANKINSFNRSSCELGMKGANMLMDAIDASMQSSAVNQSKGGSSDFNKARENPPPPTKDVEPPNPVYAALKQKNVNAWFPDGDGDDFLRAMMSITGGVIIKYETSTDGTRSIVSEFTPLITIQDLIKGGDLDAWQCSDSTYCETPTKGTVNIPGMEELVRDSILGNDGGSVPGFIKLFTDGTRKLSAGESSLLQGLQPNVGALIRDLSRDPGTAREFGKQASATIARATACILVDDIFRSAKTAIGAALWKSKDAAVQKVKDNHVAAMDECKRIQTDMDSFQNLTESYKFLRSQIDQRVAANRPTGRFGK